MADTGAYLAQLARNIRRNTTFVMVVVVVALEPELKPDPEEDKKPVPAKDPIGDFTGPNDDDDDDKKPLALGIENHLAEFARARDARTHHDYPKGVDWKDGVLQDLADPTKTVHVNLEDINVPLGVTRFSRGYYYTNIDWELEQLKRTLENKKKHNLPGANIEFWKNSNERANTPPELDPDRNENQEPVQSSS